MRSVEEDKVYTAYSHANWHQDASTVDVDGILIDFTKAWMAIGGRNGVGKTRLLTRICETLSSADKGSVAYIDPHSQGEAFLEVLRKRADLDGMIEEVDAHQVSGGLRQAIERCVGKAYDSVEWYELELGVSTDSSQGSYDAIPYFRVQAGDIFYGSLEMGRGEYAIHLIWWLLYQLRDDENITLLLDEPDAFIPPDNSEILLRRILLFAKERRWRVFLTTHSREIYDRALEFDRFIALTAGSDGKAIAVDPWVQTIRQVWHPRPELQRLVFVEDESAYHLMMALLRRAGGEWVESSAVTWLTGCGDMVGLRKHWQARSRSRIGAMFIFDGDKNKSDSDVPPPPSRSWPTLFLPTQGDPDDLYKTLEDDASSLAQWTKLNKDDVLVHVNSHRSDDPHDWVNSLAALGSRENTLRALAEMWVHRNARESEDFIESFKVADRSQTVV